MMNDARIAHPACSVVRLREVFSVIRTSSYQHVHDDHTDPDGELAGHKHPVYSVIPPEKRRRANSTSGMLITYWKKPRRTTTTDSSHPHQRYPNLRGVTHILRPNQVWQADLSYVRMTDGFVSVTCVLDSFTHEIVGWSIAERLTADVALEALDNALITRCRQAGLIHQYDQGVQYACTAYTEVLNRADIIPRMSRTGNPYDNARMESFFKTLRMEEENLQEYANLDEALDCIARFITLYNERRLHSILWAGPSGIRRPVSSSTDVT